jgi:hypothetical protein
MEPAHPSEPDLPVSSEDSQRRIAETNSMRTVPQSAPPFAPVSSTPECSLPSASPPVTRTSKRRRRLGEQPPIAPQEWTTDATSVAGVASVRGQTSSRKEMVAEAQLAERRRVGGTAAASQDSNDKSAEVEVSERGEDEGDPTDVEPDLEETTAMAMRDRVVQCQRLFAWTWGLTLRT